jgi:UDP-N-acetylmuramoyl-L-alanyl-D-glutamate--2,6-diaminopimelate ligase
MNLRDLIKGLSCETITGRKDLEIEGIDSDSRKIGRGYLFVAISGYRDDGCNYIDAALDKGAVAVVTEKSMNLPDHVTVIKVKDSRTALAKLSSNYYKNPSHDMHLIGITGTSGKTTTTYLIKSIMEESGLKCGIIGTMGNIINKEVVKTGNTTPESLIIQKYLYEMLKSGTEYCAMEVSSHSIFLKRIEYCEFEIGLFTNLSRDHLDFHKTMDDYFEVKSRLFYKTNKYNIVNLDDEYGRRLIEKIEDSKVPLLTYGFDAKGDIFATDVKYSLNGVNFLLNTPKGSIPINFNIPGKFSVYNSLAAASCAYAYNIDLDNIKKGLEKVQGVKGRFEIVPTKRDFSVIIDFAHTPNELENLLTLIDEFAQGRKVVVFGAGGNRDKTKRPIMGEVVANHCDLPIVTSDNPRDEDPEKIIDDVIVGVKKVTDNYIKIIDRREAIKYAVENAKPNDIIILAGKGHETYTIIKGKKLPFDERKIVEDTLKELNHER